MQKLLFILFTITIVVPFLAWHVFQEWREGRRR